MDFPKIGFSVRYVGFGDGIFKFILVFSPIALLIILGGLQYGWPFSGEQPVPGWVDLKKIGPVDVHVRRIKSVDTIFFMDPVTQKRFSIEANNLSEGISIRDLENKPSNVYLQVCEKNKRMQIWDVEVNGKDAFSYGRALGKYQFLLRQERQVRYITSIAFLVGIFSVFKFVRMR